MAATKYDRRYTSDPPEGYNQSRATLRERFGPRQIDASAPLSPRDMTRTTTSLEPPDEYGKTPERSWSDFFRKGPVSAQPTGSPIMAGAQPQTEQSGLPLQQPLASTPPPLAPARTDFLKSAMDNTHKFWNRMGAQFSNAQGVRVSVPGMGQTKAGMSFTSNYGTGSVASASQTSLRRLMRDVSYI